eukprot:CAMPEP_0114521362 /NCGR_PEP_ID=MMETSP0109-20121206/20144_1 /TAXON_ID=29199 /ORGANISM="Chlorarachnion reptans, Strain CCCM449" /LENGTH=98 /DNA_ID=CAMNT_0001702459 /DNA_START=306 /DNA_END=602 /DNA_ORIENTATION=+
MNATRSPHTSEIWLESVASCLPPLSAGTLEQRTGVSKSLRNSSTRSSFGILTPISLRFQDFLCSLCSIMIRGSELDAGRMNVYGPGRVCFNSLKAALD